MTITIGTDDDHPDTLDLSLVERATALIPLLREEAAEGTRNRRLTPRALKALDDAGIFRMLLPQRLGGPGATFETVAAVVAELARGDGSAAWVSNLLVTATGFATTFSQQAQDDVFGTDLPHTRLSGSFAPGSVGEEVEGGYRISGRWPYSTGSFAADWATVGVLIEQPVGPPRLGLALVPSSAFTLEDTWLVAGMKATGSNTIIVDSHVVPYHRVQLLEDMTAGSSATPFRDEPLARTSIPAASGLLSVAVHVGLARRALEICCAKVPGKPVMYTSYADAADSPTHQVAVATASTDIHIAELLLTEAARAVDGAARSGVELPFEVRAKLRNNIGVVAEMANAAIDSLMTVVGSGAFFETNILSQIWADAAIITRHAYIDPNLGREAYGQVLLGSENRVMSL